jgi:integrase
MARLNVDGHVRLRSRGRWQMIVSIDGRRYYGTCRAKNKSEAAEKIKVWKASLMKSEAKRAEGVDVDRTLTQHLDEFRNHSIPGMKTAKSKQGYTGVCDRLQYWLENVEKRNPRVISLSRGLFFRYLEWRAQHQWRYRRSVKKTEVVQRPISLRTLQKERILLHKVLGRAVLEGILDSNPVKGTEPYRLPKRQKMTVATREQVQSLEEHIRGDMRKLIIATAYESAARSESEVLWVRWEDIDLERGILHVFNDDEVHTTKTHTSRDIPLSGELTERFRAHAARYRFRLYNGHRSPWVFHHTNDRYAPAGSRIRSIRHAFRRAAKRAGLPDDFCQHDLRHTRITHLIAEGVPQKVVQEIAGHLDPATTDGYTHLATEDLQDGLNRGSTGVDAAALRALMNDSNPTVRALATAFAQNALRAAG